MRRKAQGAIEYLFMVATAMITIVIVIKFVIGPGKEAGSIISAAAGNITSKLSAELSEAIHALGG